MANIQDQLLPALATKAPRTSQLNDPKSRPTSDDESGSEVDCVHWDDAALWADREPWASEQASSQINSRGADHAVEGNRAT